MRRIFAFVAVSAAVAGTFALAVPAAQAKPTPPLPPASLVMPLVLTVDEMKAAAKDSANFVETTPLRCTAFNDPSLLCEIQWSPATGSDWTDPLPYYTSVRAFGGPKVATRFWNAYVRKSVIDGATVTFLTKTAKEVTFAADYASDEFGRNVFTFLRLKSSVVMARCTGASKISPSNPIVACSQAVAQAQADKVLAAQTSLG